MAMIDSTFGAALVGLVVSACLFGITLMQTFSYFRQYSNDTSVIKSLVITLTILDTLHLVLCTRTAYWYLVTNFGDSDNLDITTWSMALQTDCNGLIGFIVELFFARRVWMMGHNWIITGVIVVFASLHFGLGVVFTVDSFVLGRFSKFKRLTWVTSVGLGSAAAADIIIGVAMCYYLYTKRTGLRTTDSVVSTLMAYSINSGVTTSVIAAVCVITFAAMPTNFVWLSFFWIIGKCYVNSFLALLNSREGLRDRVSKGVQLNRFGPYSFHQSYPEGPKTPHKSSPARTDGVSVCIETITDYSPHYAHKAHGSSGGHERMDPITEVEMKEGMDREDATSSLSATPIV